MALTYDFDMFSIIPKELQAQYGELFADIGMKEQASQQRALFRDPAAVAALQGASEEVRKCLLDSGFGINVYDSGAGPGRYPAADAPARAEVIERLMENLEKLPPDADWNGFDIEAFAMAALTAKPLQQQASNPQVAAAAQTPRQPNPESMRGGETLDAFFGNAAGTPPKPAATPGPDMDAFFSGSAASTAMQSPPSGPDMDAFFSAPPKQGSAAPVPRPMTAEDIRMTIDTAPPKKVGLGPVKMGMMALGLFVVVTLLGNGASTAKLVEVATGGRMVTIGQ